MQKMIKDLLSFSRIATKGKLFKNTNLKTILKVTIFNLRILIEETGCDIKIGKMPNIVCDNSLFISLFQNLIENAIKFRSGKKPLIEINAKKDSNNWIISVKDNGIGIKEEYKEKIFIIFQKLHTKDEYPGTGIGLSLCKKIVESHDGRIWVESDGVSGSTFYISLPINIKKEYINET
jgi:light-regulated signal transduction histidine kinase (bacteriophytochrome)